MLPADSGNGASSHTKNAIAMPVLVNEGMKDAD